MSATPYRRSFRAGSPHFLALFGALFTLWRAAVVVARLGIPMSYPFTVLLLKPDYEADVFGQDTYTALVCIDEDDPEKACRAAQLEAMAQRPADDSLLEELDDYHPLFMCRGHMTNLALQLA